MHSQHAITTINVQSRAPGGEWQVRNAFIDENKLVQAGSMPKASLLALANKTMQAWRSYEDGRQLRVYNSDDVRQQEPAARSLGAAATPPEMLEVAESPVPTLPPIPHATTNEKLIVSKIVADVLAAGAVITVNDGEEDTLSLSADPQAIFTALSSTDEDYLIVTQVTGKVSWVRLVWGNDVDVISDYQVSLEALLAGANALAEELDQ
jgi:hypothetical protein